MWAALIPVIGVLLQIISNIIVHIFSSQDKKVDKRNASLEIAADSAKKGDYDTFFDALAKFHSTF